MLDMIYSNRIDQWAVLMKFRKDPLGRRFCTISCTRDCMAMRTGKVRRSFFVVNDSERIRVQFMRSISPQDAPCVISSCTTCGVVHEGYCTCCDSYTADQCIDISKKHSICKICMDKIEKSQLATAPEEVHEWLMLTWLSRVGSRRRIPLFTKTVKTWVKKNLKQQRQKNRTLRDQLKYTGLRAVRNKRT